MRKIDYDSEYNRKLNENILKVRSDINEEYMQRKIENYSKKFDLPYNFVKRKIITDNIFALDFAVDPSRQTYHEEYAYKFINENPFIENMERLPQSNKGALYIINGSLVEWTKLTAENKSENVKALDFKWNIIGKNEKIYTIFASHKYTKEEGGSQDNQFHDLCTSMKHAKICKNPNTYFLAIGDGPYYQKKKINNLTRLEYMNQEFGNERCIALTSNDIDEFIDKIRNL